MGVKRSFRDNFNQRLSHFLHGCRMKQFLLAVNASALSLSLITSGSPAVAGIKPRLASQHIREMISGKRLVSLPSEAPSSEDFHSNGKWFTWQGGRYARNHSGRWFVKSNRLCVAVDGGNIDCRSVWLGPEPATVAMRKPISWATGGDVVVRNVTKITK